MSASSSFLSAVCRCVAVLSLFSILKGRRSRFKISRFQDVESFNPKGETVKIKVRSTLRSDVCILPVGTMELSHDIVAFNSG